MSDNTQLTSASGYNVKNMIFSDPQHNSIPNTVPQISYKRINISTKNPDGTVGDLIIPTSKLFSFGVSENTNPETGKVNGYVLPICLWNKDGASTEEKDFTDTIDNIVEKCKDHLVSVKDDIEVYDLSKSDLKKFNPLYWKREKGKIVEGTGPNLYTKLILSKKKGNTKILTMFYNDRGEEIDPYTLLGKYCHVNCAIKIESIFIGNKISLQIKLYEAEVTLIDTGMKRMLKKRPPSIRKVTESSSRPLDNKDDDDDEDSEASIKDSEDEEEVEVESKQPKKKVVKRKVKKVVKKKN